MEIRSDQIEAGQMLGTESGLLDIYDGLKTPVSDDVISLSGEHTEAIETFTENALDGFGPLFHEPESTHAQREHGVPTLLARVDCTVVGGDIAFYEMEDSPSGVGITDILHKRANGVGIADAVLSHYQDVTGQTPRIIISSMRNHGTDDALVFGDDNYHYDPTSTMPQRQVRDDEIVIVKTIPGDRGSVLPYADLSEQAVAPLITEGDKAYLLRTGLCRVVTDERSLLSHQGELQSQVVKAAVGSMAMGVSIFLDESDRSMFGKQGTVKQSRLLRDLAGYVERDGYALTQEFQAPIQVSNAERRNNLIMRIFALVSGGSEGPKAEVIGGCYVARPELVVHGASNSVGGAVLV